MSITTAIATYFLIWWITLFVVLPFGVRAQGEEGAAGTDPGAPGLPRMLRKLLWTTGIATVLFAVCAVVYIQRWITLDDLARLMGVKTRVL
jgi:predicted secreted protein